MNDFAKSLLDKSLEFGVRIVRLSDFLSDGKKNLAIVRQILKSGTSIGANIREAQYAQSEADFVSKLSIALKEGSETQYWLELLNRTEYITADQFASLSADCNHLVGLLVRVIKRMKAKRVVQGTSTHQPSNLLNF